MPTVNGIWGGNRNHCTLLTYKLWQQFIVPFCTGVLVHSHIYTAVAEKRFSDFQLLVLESSPCLSYRYSHSLVALHNYKSRQHMPAVAQFQHATLITPQIEDRLINLGRLLFFN
jgi:hypothetical protein